jgi:glutamate--cysteine ligase
MLKFTCCDAAQFFTAQDAQVLRGIQRGYEKECLRVTPEGLLAQTPHPLGLGSKLTHPLITTDYSEALLEFITPPSSDTAFPLACLQDIHRYTAQHLEGNVLWAGSMPAVLGLDADIPLANYGSSNSARIKYVYREGLGHRYGRHMQTIAGVHYNWSLPQAFWEALHACYESTTPLQDFISEQYFALIRNFLRYSWLIPYLFGASPALHSSFLQGRKPVLSVMGDAASAHTLFGPHATSLRMSDLGYQNRAQSHLNVSFNSLGEYTRALNTAMHTPDPFYQAIGTKDGDHWKQLNANVLQIENEFYAGIRPKRVGKLGERPAIALQKYGVEYVEVRLFDLNPLVDIGITPEQATFADAFLLMCLFRQSPPITSREEAENAENKRRVVSHGRDPELQLMVHNTEQAMQPLAHALFDDMAIFAAQLDAAHGVDRYTQTLAQLRQRIDAPHTTPSAHVLEGVLAAGGHMPYIMGLSQQHLASLRAQPLDAATQARFDDAARVSLMEQQHMEDKPQGRFEDYVAAYYA